MTLFFALPYILNMMSTLMCILIIVLVIVITLIITQNDILGALGASGGYVYPAEPSLLSESEKEFLNDDTKVSKLIQFLQGNTMKVLEYILTNKSNVKILPLYDLRDKTKLLRYENKQLANDINDIINETNLEVEHGMTPEEYGKNKIKQLKVMRQTLGIVTDKHYKSFPGVIVQPIAIDEHAVGLIINYITKQMLYIDSHAQYTSYGSSEKFATLVGKILKKNPMMHDFQFRFIYDLTKHYSCPIFQGSFKEKKGLCTLWSVYLLSLYALNKPSDFEKIISVHARNAPWTKRRLQDLGYKIYTKFKKEIDQIQPSGVWSLA